MIPTELHEFFADILHRIERVEGRIENRKRTGLVTEVDAKRGLARVELGTDAQSGKQFISPWIPWDEMAMGKIKWHTPPSVGEQVTVESESGEFSDARIKTSVSSDQNPRPSQNENEHVRTVGNVRILEKDGEVHITVGGAELIVTPGKITLKCGEIEFDGHVVVKGDMDQTGTHTDKIGHHV